MPDLFYQYLRCRDVEASRRRRIVSVETKNVPDSVDECEYRIQCIIIVGRETTSDRTSIVVLTTRLYQPRQTDDLHINYFTSSID